MEISLAKDKLPSLLVHGIFKTKPETFQEKYLVCLSVYILGGGLAGATASIG